MANSLFYLKENILGTFPQKIFRDPPVPSAFKWLGNFNTSTWFSYHLYYPWPTIIGPEFVLIRFRFVYTLSMVNRIKGSWEPIAKVYKLDSSSLHRFSSFSSFPVATTLRYLWSETGWFSIVIIIYWFVHCVTSKLPPPCVDQCQVLTVDNRFACYSW